MGGFRCYCIRWADSTTYANDNTGVKACLEDVCSKFLLDSSYHGWSLDTEPCPDNEAILLTPSYSVYAMFFVHTTGSRMMLALNYNGLSAASVTTHSKSTVDSRWHQSKCPTVFYSPTYSSGGSTSTQLIGGLIGCYIPKTVSGDQEKFNPSVDMTSSSFFPSSATMICCTAPSATHTYTNSSYPSVAYKNYNFSASMIRQGSSALFYDSSSRYYANSSFGAPSSNRKTYSVLADDRENIILCSQCVSASIVRPAIRWCMMGKLKPEENPDECKGYSVCQNFLNTTISKVGVSNSTSASNPFDGYTATSDSYMFSSVPQQINPYFVSNISPSFRDSNNNILITQPFPIGSSRNKTIDGEYHYSLCPVSVAGGYTTIKSWIDYNNIRTIRYDVNIPPGSYFGNNKWLFIGYHWSFLGWSSINSSASTYSSIDTNSQLDMLVIKLDDGNVDDPFVWRAD